MIIIRKIGDFVKESVSLKLEIKVSKYSSERSAIE